MSNKTDTSYDITDLFPQPLVKMDIDHHAAVSVFDNIVKNNTPEADILRKPDEPTNYYNTKNVFRLFSELQPMHDQIIEKANYVYKDILNYNNTLRMTNAWFNECQVGGYQFMHNHCNSIISGTVYLRADRQTNIQFRSPFAEAPTITNHIKDEQSKYPNKNGHNYHQKLHTVFIREGHVLFWPSFMIHGYQNNRTPNRLSISFNLLPQQVNTTYQI